MRCCARPPSWSQTTIATRVPEDWPDEKVVETRQVLDEHGLRVGEYVQFRCDFASAVPVEHKAAMADYRRQLRHAGIIGAAFVGFNIVCNRETVRMWTQERLGAGASPPLENWPPRPRRPGWTWCSTLIT